MDTGEGKGISGLIPSRDGREIAFSAADSSLPPRFTLYVIPVAGGEPRELLSGQKSTQPIAWTPDGEYVLFAKRDRTRELWRISASGGEPEKLDWDITGTRYLRMHPDGRRFAFVAGEVEREVWVMEKLLPGDWEPRTTGG